METAIPLPFIPYVEFAGGKPFPEGLTRNQVASLGCVYFSPKDAEIDKLLGFLQQHVRIQTFVNVSSVSSIDDIVSILDAGASTVFVQSTQLADLGTFSSRIGLLYSHDSLDLGQSTAGGALVQYKDNITACVAILQKLKDARVSPVFLVSDQTQNMQASVDAAREHSAIPLLRTTKLTMENTSNQSQLSVPEIIAASWISDRSDKLIPTVVTDVRGIALGLVYSSQKSLAESFKSGTGVYQSRKRGLWYKGATSGDTQELVKVSLDCDKDCLKFVVKQQGRGMPLSIFVLTDPSNWKGFCHLPQFTCFGEYSGMSKLEKTLLSRKESAPEGSYTARLFSDEKLLRAKIMEEAEELCDAKTSKDVAFEAADLIYFALTKAVGAGVSLADIERSLDAKSVKIKRRQGDAKTKWVEKDSLAISASRTQEQNETVKEGSPNAKGENDHLRVHNSRIRMTRYNVAATSPELLQQVLQRPSQKSPELIMGIVIPIIKNVQERGDVALLEYTHKFEKAISLKSAVLKAPFPQELMNLSSDTIKAIDTSFENIHKFHSAQKEEKPLLVETMPGITCSRFSRPIERVGLYVPGGTAVLPSTALMLGVPAMVAGCKKIVLASPPRADGSLSPEIVYVAHKVGAESIVLAGGAQAVAAMAYGTESVSKVDKILGPGNQFVTAAKMYVSNDTNAGVSIDMPAGPSEVLVIADKSANPAFVASDLLSQAEHGTDSQVILIAVDLSEAELQGIEDELHTQAMALPRVDIVRGAIEHSVTLVVRDLREAMKLSNDYAPEHLILQIEDAASVVDLVENAGSVFVGEWTPESVGDYSAGVNHSLPTYGYAKQYSGVNLGSYLKHITSSNLTSQGLRNVGGAVMQLARVEELEAHRRAVGIRLKYMDERNL